MPVMANPGSEPFETGVIGWVMPPNTDLLTRLLLPLKRGFLRAPPSAPFTMHAGFLHDGAASRVAERSVMPQAAIRRLWQPRKFSSDLLRHSDEPFFRRV